MKELSYFRGVVPSDTCCSATFYGLFTVDFTLFNEAGLFLSRPTYLKHILKRTCNVITSPTCILKLACYEISSFGGAHFHSTAFTKRFRISWTFKTHFTSEKRHKNKEFLMFSFRDK